jgi:hypothetical protein
MIVCRRDKERAQVLSKLKTEKGKFFIFDKNLRNEIIIIHKY